jgi:Ca-activated chloride channel family protein
MNLVDSEYLGLLWILPFLGAFFLWSFRSRRRRLETLIAPALIPRLTREFNRPKVIVRALLLTGFFAMGILSLARPQWGMRQETVQRQGVDVLVALDTSYSMNAEDVAPNRLEKAKSEIRGLIGRLKGDRIGLIAFAGTAVVQCPLTLDYGAASLFLDIADTETIPEPGTSLAAAIQTATSAFIAKERKYKVLVIITDGEDLEGQVQTAIDQAREGGVITYTVGVGSPEGRPIPVRDMKGDIIEYRKDPEGQVVVSRLDERALAQIAAETGGRYFRATTSEGELDRIYDDISHMEKKQLESRLYRNFEDQFQYPLALAILFLVAEAWMSERRRPGLGWLARFYSRTRPANSDV